MKRKVLKTLLCMSITTTMLFGETAAILADTVETNENVVTETDLEQQELESAEVGSKGEKMVSSHVLADVTGVVYDAAAQVLSWNKVPGAGSYSVIVKDASGNEVYKTDVSGVYVSLRDHEFEMGQAYVVSITAENEDELCQVATDVTDAQSRTIPYDERKVTQIQTATGTEKRYTLYKHPASTNPATVSLVLNADITTSVTALSGIALKEVTDSNAVFRITPSTLQPHEGVEYIYSNNPEYRSNAAEGLSVHSALVYSDTDYAVRLDLFKPGETIYIKARVYNPNYDYKKFPGQTSENRYGAQVSTSYKVPSVDLEDVSVVVDGSSIVLKPEAPVIVAGYQYQRKNGKKWENLAQQGDNYTDAGLKADTKYTYRVRGYMYNEATKKTSYTNWKTVSATTWGASLNLKADAQNAKSVKLSWSKVPGAKGYEVYRVNTNSINKTSKNGETNEWFNNATLIKTIKKAKTTKYKDKKLTKGSNYTYVVRAYRTVGKNKCYIEESTSVTLSGEDGIGTYREYYDGKGRLNVKWSKMADISGYKVEVYDEATNSYVAYKTLKKTATSITFPAVSVGAKKVKYRICPYKGDKVYSEITVNAQPSLAVVKGVKAVQTAEGIQVSWNPVAGADYYEVYRSKQDAFYYDENTKTYRKPEDAVLVYDANYVDTSAGISLAVTEAPKVEKGYTSIKVLVPEDKVTYDEDYEGYIYNDGNTTHDVFWDSSLNKYCYWGQGTPYSYTSYKYADSVADAKADDGCFYDEVSAYRTSNITATTVVDKTIRVKSLIRKDQDPNYSKATDPEYYMDSDGDYVSTGSYVYYQKNPDGSLKTKEVTKNQGPEIGTEYYYFVVACAKPANGSGENDTVTSSIGVNKGAKVVYTNVKEAKSTKLASAKSKKKATVTIKIKKAAGAKGYAIYRASKKKGKYVKVGTTTGKSYKDKNVKAGKTYYYKIASYKQSENGTFIYSKLSKPKKVKAKR